MTANKRLTPYIDLILVRTVSFPALVSAFFITGEVAGRFISCFVTVSVCAGAECFKRGDSQKSNANFLMGYAFNLCKSQIYNVPYNQYITEEGMKMTQNRVRIVDVADALGLSTATVSNVIHGKTEKISDKTVKRVQQELERSGYIPNMAGILLARNNSRIIGVVVNDHEKYEGRVLEDGFVMSSLNALSHEVNEKGYFLMIKTTSDIREIPVFASMWNMDGLILIGFCEADYESLRNQMRISFVVYDGYFEKCSKVVNLVIDHYDGGYQAGKYLKELGHKKALCIADNFICMDKERIEGFRKAFEQGETYRWEIPKTEKERMRFYEDNYRQLLKNNVTAVFAVSDFYALEFMRFLQGKNLRIPDDIQIIGFDDNMASRESNPPLTTIHQEASLRAKAAIECLEEMRDGAKYKTEIVLQVNLIKRESTRKL
nr:LacI family DNA-binding transcriptional regulator [Ligilactobacillus ruminis]